ncbi:MAG: hypothetical protein HQL67_07525 [Magnetococcales bacterium]|nr:hypothetical protein [Magnetococcales bacterium]
MKIFSDQFKSNISFQYSCFDRVVIRGYILNLFTTGGIVILLRALGFHKLSDGIMRILTDQLNAHICKEAEFHNIPIHWWPSVDGGKSGAKLKYVTDPLVQTGGNNALDRKLSKRWHRPKFR